MDHHTEFGAYFSPEISGIARCCNTVTTNGELAIDCIQGQAKYQLAVIQR